MEQQFKIPLAYSFSHYDEQVLKESSSGGAFFAIASSFIKTFDGLVCAATINNDGIVYHKTVSTIGELHTLMKSKYVFSDFKDSLNDVINSIKQNRYVLFVGTPCQVSALMMVIKANHLEKFKKYLYSIDFVCHGAPQQNAFNKYLTELQTKNKKISIDFRFKKKSWEHFLIRINNKFEPFSKNFYMRLFLKNYLLPERCFDCKYKFENRYSDCTIGDFWGIKKTYPEFYNKLGTSLVIIRNNDDFFINALRQQGLLNQVVFSLAIRNNAAYSKKPIKPIKYEAFKADFLAMSYKELNKKYNKNGDKLARLVTKFTKILKTNKVKKEKKKIDVGIITCNSYQNFGNRLQNYAIISYLSKKGYECRNIVFDNKIKYGFLYIFIRLKRSLLERKSKDNFKKKRLIYKTSKKYEGKTYIASSDLCCNNFLYNFSNIIVGGDQVWNYDYIESTFNNLMFYRERPELLRVCSFSASFGHNNFSNEIKTLFVDAFQHNFDMIGFREKDCVSKFNTILPKAVYTPDPVLLLNNNEWDEAILKYSSIIPPNGKYAFFYFLSQDDTNKKNALKNANDRGLKIIDVLDRNDKYFLINQFDFIKLIKNSSEVYTDSFHALVFSGLYKKHVIVFGRNDKQTMNNRINDLLLQTKSNIQINNLDGGVVSFDNFSNKSSINFLNSFFKR